MNRFGIIGLGGWALRLIENINPDQRISAVLTQRTDAHEILPKQTKVVRTYDEFVTIGLDGIVIANGASLHQQALKEVRKRLPTVKILVEKPFALSTHEIPAEYFGKAEDLRVLVNHTLLFNQNLLEMKESLSEIPKKIVSIECSRGPQRSDCSGLWDYGPHAVSVALYLCDALDRSVNCEVREVSHMQTHWGSLAYFRLLVNEQTEIECFVGNGFPIKIRRYEIFCGTDKNPKTFDGLIEVDPKPLQSLFAQFGSEAGGGTTKKDVRWGAKIGIRITEILETVETKLKAYPSTT
jgi:predicted dehydrogenase